MNFSRNETYNLNKLRSSLIDETYKFSGYNEFVVYEPKERIINAPFYKDKIIQVAINNVLKEVINPTFIFDSYACIDNKGTHKCAKRIQYFMKKAKWMYGEEAFIIKMDMKKFYYSIDRDILKDILTKKIKCQKTLRLIFGIIDSAGLIDELGLPLGNTLSQICSNIYMNEADQFAKRKLSLKFYVRYADDIFIIVENKKKAQKVFEEMRVFIKENLNLDLSEDKSKIFPINQGVNGIGYKIHTTHMLLRNESKRNVKRRIKSIPRLILSGRISVKKAEQMLNSWKGHAEHACSYNFIKSLVSKNKFLFISDDGSLKVDKTQLTEE